MSPPVSRIMYDTSYHPEAPSERLSKQFTAHFIHIYFMTAINPLQWRQTQMRKLTDHVSTVETKLQIAADCFLQATDIYNWRGIAPTKARTTVDDKKKYNYVAEFPLPGIIKCWRTKENVMLKMKFLLMWSSDQQVKEDDVNSALICHKAKRTFDTQDGWQNCQAQTKTNNAWEFQSPQNIKAYYWPKLTIMTETQWRNWCIVAVKLAESFLVESIPYVNITIRTARSKCIIASMETEERKFITIMNILIHEWYLHTNKFSVLYYQLMGTIFCM
jgi:hypothetical protein